MNLRRPGIRLAAAFALLLSAAAPAQQGSAAPTIRWSTVAELNAAPVDQYLFLTGTITSIKAPDAGTRQPWIIYVADGESFARIVVAQDTWARIEGAERFEKGLAVQAYGKVNDYKGIRQLLAEGPKWLRIDPLAGGVPASALHDGRGAAASDRATLVTISSIGVGGIGARVRVRGVVEEVAPSPSPKTPTKLALRDSSGAIKVVYWGEVASTLPASETPAEGTEFEATGVIQEYRGEMQLRVDDAGDLFRSRALSRAGGY